MEEQNMDELKLIRLGGLVYHLEMTNPETGWTKVKNMNGTMFWLPDEILDEIEHIQKGIENVKVFNKESASEYVEKITEMKKKIDSQRKSIEYYKNERNSYKHIANKQAKDWEKLMDEFKEYKEINTTHIRNLTEGNSILALELAEVENKLTYSRIATLRSIGAICVLVLIILTMIII